MFRSFILAATIFATTATQFAIAARTCIQPQRQETGGEKLRILGKRAAYASFLSDECDFSSDIHRKYAELVKIVYPDSQQQQQQYIDDFKARKKTFSQDASFLGIKKRCILETGKTRAFVNEAGDDVVSYIESTIVLEQQFSKKINEYNECKTAQESELRIERAVAAQAEYERSEDYARKKAVMDIEKSFRESYMESKKGTYVLKLRNPSNQTAEFTLKCFQTGGNSKSFQMVIPSGGSTELGFMEGWPGNFTSGEKCYAFYKGEELWWYGLR